MDGDGKRFHLSHPLLKKMGFPYKLEECITKIKGAKWCATLLSHTRSSYCEDNQFHSNDLRLSIGSKFCCEFSLFEKINQEFSV